MEDLHKPPVNARKWTTKVNIAIVVAVTVVMLVGALYFLYAWDNPGEMREQVDEDVGRE